VTIILLGDCRLDGDFRNDSARVFHVYLRWCLAHVREKKRKKTSASRGARDATRRGSARRDPAAVRTVRSSRSGAFRPGGLWESFAYRYVVRREQMRTHARNRVFRLRVRCARGSRIERANWKRRFRAKEATERSRRISYAERIVSMASARARPRHKRTRGVTCAGRRRWLIVNCEWER